ncbi:MAG: NAD(P)-dependent glycerol-3-phosphate dehydrogenase [Nitrospirae bacterium]|nr:NAD(P)-dependent glycerol-3-phosphate dehydrogenase [Nitrospirota bacterium]
MSYISVIGAGSWGTALAVLLAEKEYDVSLWVHEEDIAREMKETRVNRVYLPDVELPENIKITSSFEEALYRTRYVLCVVPTQYVRSVFKEATKYLEEDAVIISASKGIEKGTLLTVSGVLSEITHHPVAVLSGPSFAKEVIKKLPTAVTLAVKDRFLGLLLQEIFNTDYFRVYTHHDVLGVELGGALKNVIAIASGISDGLGLGLDARAALITRGLAEITRLGVKMGAEEKTFSGLSGIGDLVLTCTGALSRNYTVGVKLGKGMTLKEILAGMTAVAEGVETSVSAYELSKKMSVEMPIVEQVYLVLHHGKDPSEAVRELMTRTPKEEFYYSD